jgi:hypothetical protein
MTKAVNIMICIVIIIFILPSVATVSAQLELPGYTQLQKGSALQNKEGLLFLGLQAGDTIPFSRNSFGSNQFGLQYPAFGYLWINSQSETGLVNIIMNPAFIPMTWWTYQATLSTDSNTGQQLCIQDFEILEANNLVIQENVLLTQLPNPLSAGLVPNISASFVIFGNPNCQTGFGVYIISAIWV